MNDLSGQRFGGLVVLSLSETRNERTFWLCQCDCGKTKVIRRDQLTHSGTISCGCAKPNVKHGHAGLVDSITYCSWKNMRKRCNNPNDPYYHRYGGRGIKVCPRWDSFENFLADMGERPNVSMTIDRTNNDGNYEPGNCKWSTPEQQARNREVKQS